MKYRIEIAWNWRCENKEWLMFWVLPSKSQRIITRSTFLFCVLSGCVVVVVAVAVQKGGFVCWFSPIQTMCVSMIKVDCSLPVSISLFVRTHEKKVVSCVHTYASVYVHLSARLETSWELSVFKTEKNLLQKTKKIFVWNLKLKFAPFRFAYNRVWVCIFNVKNTYAFKKKA